MMHSPPRKLRDITNGLYYLHSCNVVHGNLKGVCDYSEPRFAAILTPGQQNILMDATGRARITDFGLATITQDLYSASDDRGYTPRWTAPEILNEEGTYSREADVFSFAMVIIEVRRGLPSMNRDLVYTSTQVFTGVVPFNNKPPVATMVAIMGGKRPQRPEHPAFTDELWTLIQRCWDQDPHSRPEVSEALRVLRGS